MLGWKQSVSATALMIAATASQVSAVAAQDTGSANQLQMQESGIADIVVTANRRPESGQDVPVAITALSAEGLRQQGITTSQDLMGKIPSVVVGPNATQRSTEAITIRGQGQTNLAAPGVVKYFAEVPLITGSTIGNQGGPGILFDVGTVQVLRGPQGTLFGRNTTGGAFLIGPNKPVDRIEGHVSAQFGNYNNREFEAVFNVPLISEQLFVRLGLNKVHRDGFTRDAGVDDLTLSLPFQGPAGAPALVQGAILPGDKPNSGIAGLPGLENSRPGYKGKDYDDKHYTSVRLGVVWRPMDGVENYFQAFHTQSKNNGTGQILTAVRTTGTALVNIAGNAYGGLGTFTPTPTGIPAALLARQQALGTRETSLNNNQFEKLDVWGLINTLSIDLTADLTLRSILSYQRMKQDYSWDLDGSPLPILAQVPGIILPMRPAVTAPPGFPQDSYVPGTTTLFTNLSQVTAEPQLQGNALHGQLSFVVGGFYSYVKPEEPQSTGSYNSATFGNTAFDVRTRSKAIYGQASLDLGAFVSTLEGVSLTGGLRQTWDDIDGSRYAPSLYNIPYGQASLRSDALTWTAGIDYKASRDLLLYGKVSRGYKSGGFNFLAVRQSGLIYQPERVMSYEAGAKSDFHIGSVPVRLNANVYELRYKNIQRAFSDNVASANPQTGLDQGQITYNIGGARIRGVELEGNIRPTRALTLSGNYAYTDAKYTDYALDVAFDPLAPVKDSCQGPVTLQPGLSNLVDLTCIPFSNVAKHQFSLNARYEVPLEGNAGTLALSTNYSWIGPRYQTPASTPRDEPFGKLGSYGLLGVSLEWNGILGSRVDGRIFATNLTNKTYRVSSSPGLSNSLGFVTSIYGEPRMYGASLRVNFGD